MSVLSRLQRHFQAYLLEEDKEFLREILDVGRASARERLEIYAEAYYLRLTEALETDFKALHRLLGAGAFAEMSRAYIAAYPSHNPSIRWFGKHLADFLKSRTPYANEPALAEMAQFEWALSLCFDAADATTVNIEDIASISPERWPEMRLRFHPSVQRLDFRWNVPPIWRAMEEGIDQPTPETNEWPVGYVLWRKDQSPHFRSLEVDELWALDAAQAGQPLASICEGLCEWVDACNAAMHAAGLLKTWVTDGLIAGINAEQSCS